jgi:hypothetical protein
VVWRRWGRREERVCGGSEGLEGKEMMVEPKAFARAFLFSI